ncbi:hypothetical protein Ahy_A05g025048 [Arachis hypogaea]|uniref:Uncharacterized protein n=1 Tax=Arachis hypogaea TaxID=3818 RepID=A0A445D7H3_ARAHY|nr:hypothetical protein Ahy_A05g025048 [Arachis hypogaea]
MTFGPRNCKRLLGAKSPFSQQNLQRDVIDRDEETAIIQSNIIFLVLILGVAKDTQLIESIAKKQSQIFSEK